MIPDSHCHLDMPEFEPDLEEVLDRARRAGVDAFLCPADASSPLSLERTRLLSAAHSDIAAAAGLHPHQARLRSEAIEDRVRSLARDGLIVAVGEIGLDFHYEFSTPGEQREAFRSQLALAGECGLPVIVHSRLAGAAVREDIDAEGFASGGVLHCFTEDWEIARTVIDRGFLISFSGILTFPKARDLREVAVRVPLDRLLVETDAPYLAPVPHRGRRCEPSYVVETARLLADLKSVPYETLAAAVTDNFRALFRLSPSAPAAQSTFHL